MNTVTVDRSRTRTALRRVRILLGCYLALSAATLVAIVVMRNDSAAVNAAVWIRGSIVVASAALSVRFAAGASRGSRRALLRLRLVSGIMIVVVVAIIALPGTFPMWIKVEQGACGLILLAVAAIINGGHLRREFAAPPAG